MFDEKILCAGFGGQGVMSLGQLLAYAGMLEDKHVSWMPSYGPEMRGGTAYCNVMVSDTPVGSPIISGDATCAIVMNQPSLAKFEDAVGPGGILMVNSSLTDSKAIREDIAVYYIPALNLATECGNGQAANMIMLGAYITITRVVSITSVIEAFKKVFGNKADRLLPINEKALKKGADVVLIQQ
jgi:2-oxoglutarate ferredoxin oxidoreductase subunit gamma